MDGSNEVKCESSDDDDNDFRDLLEEPDVLRLQESPGEKASQADQEELGDSYSLASGEQGIEEEDLTFREQGITEKEPDQVTESMKRTVFLTFKTESAAEAFLKSHAWDANTCIVDKGMQEDYITQLREKMEEEQWPVA